MAAQQTNLGTIRQQNRRQFALGIGLLTILSLGSTYSPEVAAQEQGRFAMYGSYQLPSADRPALRNNGPISIPIKALVERVAKGSRHRAGGQRRFHYDIDTLGHGMKLRMRMRF